MEVEASESTKASKQQQPKGISLERQSSSTATKKKNDKAQQKDEGGDDDTDAAAVSSPAPPAKARLSGFSLTSVVKKPAQLDLKDDDSKKNVFLPTANNTTSSTTNEDQLPSSPGSEPAAKTAVEDI